MKEKVICIFGDSTAWGAWDLDKGGWANRLSLYVNKGNLDGKHYISVYNLSVDGNTTADLLKRMKSECKAREPDLIIFSIGDNDSFSNKNKKVKVTLNNFERNIKKLILIAREFTHNLVFTGFYDFDESKTMPVSWDDNGYYVNEVTKKYDFLLRKITKDENVFYVSLSGLFDKKDFEDGVHLTSKGHEKLFNKVRDFLEEEKLI